MVRTVNVTLVSCCSTGHFLRLSGFKSVFVVVVVDELLLFSLVGLVSVTYIFIHTGSVAALTLSRFGSLVPLLEQDVCLCS